MFVSRVLKSFFALAAASLMVASGAAQNAAPQPTATSVAAPGYKLGTGDKVRVTVFGEPSLNGEYPVGPDGTVALPLIGNVVARDHSVEEVKQAIVSKLSPAFLLNPLVSVDMISFRPYYILGQVNRPGSYPYVDGLTVDQAVAIANGYTLQASRGKVFIRHADSVKESTYKNKGAPVMIKPGDTIRIGERIF